MGELFLTQVALGPQLVRPGTRRAGRAPANRAPRTGDSCSTRGRLSAGAPGEGVRPRQDEVSARCALGLASGFMRPVASPASNLASDVPLGPRPRRLSAGRGLQYCSRSGYQSGYQSERNCTQLDPSRTALASQIGLLPNTCDPLVVQAVAGSSYDPSVTFTVAWLRSRQPGTLLHCESEPGGAESAR